MRTKLAILAATMVVAVPLCEVSAQAQTKTKEKAAPVEVDYGAVYKEGVALYNAQKYREADAKFLQVLRKYPQHPQSGRYRSMLRIELRKLAAQPAMKKALAKLTLPKADFEEAPLFEVLEFATRKAKELSGGKTHPGLVIIGGNPVRDRLVTIQVSQMPLDKFIEFAVQQADARVEFDPYALKVKPNPTAEEQKAAIDAQLKKGEAIESKRRKAKEEADSPFNKRRGR